MRTTLLLGTIVVVITLAAARRAEACSPAPDVQVLDNLAGLDAVPVAGIVPIFVSVNIDASITVTVTDAGGQPVPGSFDISGRELDDWYDIFGRYVDGRLIWRADAPLADGASYTMTIDSDGNFNTGPHTVQFTTRSQPGDVSPEFTITQTRFIENIYASEHVCCGTAVDSCTGQEVDSDCWATALDTSYLLNARLAFTAAAGRYMELSVSSDSSNKASATAGANEASAGAWLDYLELSQCLTITATSMLDATSFTATTCVSEIDLEPDTVPELYDANVCDDPNPTPTSEAGGCSAGSSPESGLALVVLALLLAARRFRRAR